MNAAQPRSTLTDVGLLLIRVMLGVVFLYHGGQKLFGPNFFDGPGIENFANYLGSIGVPSPTLSAWVAALAEFVGGVTLLIGTGMRFVIPFTAITMLVAAIKVHGEAFGAQNQGMEYPLTLAVVLIGLTCTGPGRITVGRALSKRVSP